MQIGQFELRVEAPGRHYSFWRKPLEDRDPVKYGEARETPHGLTVTPADERAMGYGVPNLEAAAFYLAGFFNGAFAAEGARAVRVAESGTIEGGPHAL